jgi:hypothetical protein
MREEVSGDPDIALIIFPFLYAELVSAFQRLPL